MGETASQKTRKDLRIAVGLHLYSIDSGKAANVFWRLSLFHVQILPKITSFLCNKSLQALGYFTPRLYLRNR